VSLPGFAAGRSEFACFPVEIKPSVDPCLLNGRSFTLSPIFFARPVWERHLTSS
jgi:hypothetical protein